MHQNLSPQSWVAWLAVLAIVAWSTAAAQVNSVDGSKISPGSPFRQGPYEVDPNLPRGPYLDRPAGGGIISWHYPTNGAQFNPFIPELEFNGKGADYLGFLDGEGTLLEASDHAIYLYNGSAHRLQKRYDTFAAIPQSLFPQVRNSTVDYMLPGNESNYPSDGQRGGSSRPEPDPNFPGYSTPGANTHPWPIIWTGLSGTTIPVFFLKGEAGRRGAGTPSLSMTKNRYLGFNDEGAWLESINNQHVYVWSGARLRLKMRYHDIKSVPRAVLMSLHNAQIEDLLNTSKAPTKEPATSAPASRVRANSGTSAMLGDPDQIRQALGKLQAGAQSRAAASAVQTPSTVGDLSGTQAALNGAVLSFISKDGSRRSFTVVRPRQQIGLAGTTGSWIAPQEQILFMVQGDRTVSGQRIPAKVLPALLPEHAPQ